MLILNGKPHINSGTASCIYLRRRKHRSFFSAFSCHKSSHLSLACFLCQLDQLYCFLYSSWYVNVISSSFFPITLILCIMWTTALRSRVSIVENCVKWKSNGSVTSIFQHIGQFVFQSADRFFRIFRNPCVFGFVVGIFFFVDCAGNQVFHKGGP